MRTHIAIVLTAALVFCTGCPTPEPDPLLFRVGAELKEKYEAKLLDGQLKLHIAGFVHPAGLEGRHLLSLRIKIRHEELARALDCNPERISVFVGEAKMPRYLRGVRPEPPEVRPGYYEVRVEFAAPLPPEGPPPITDASEFKIELGDFILYGDSTLPFGTIVAVDPSMTETVTAE